MKSPVLTDLVHIIHIIIIQTISGEITSSDRPGTQSYISELYRTYLVKSPVLTDLIHNHTSIIETISDEITSSDWPDTQSYINYRDHIWWNHQFWPTWYTLYSEDRNTWDVTCCGCARQLTGCGQAVDVTLTPSWRWHVSAGRPASGRSVSGTCQGCLTSY